MSKIVQSQKKLRKSVFEYFSNPNAQLKDEDDIHALATTLGVEPSVLEEEIYLILHDFLGAGRFVEASGNVNIDPQQLQMGIKVEREHTACDLIAERIAKDHLTELGDYYTRLDKMEREGNVMNRQSSITLHQARVARRAGKFTKVAGRIDLYQDIDTNDFWKISDDKQNVVRLFTEENGLIKE